jgi:hypothetical protein
VSDTTKITKKLTIIGIGHRPDNDNADGSTSVSGNFFFEGGSDNSALMGLYLSGNVNIGTSASAVDNFLLRYCNVNSVLVANSNCHDVRINQNYMRFTSSGGNSPVTFSNNISGAINSVKGGIIDHNIIKSHNSHNNSIFDAVYDTQIKNNIFVDNGGFVAYTGSIVTNNMGLVNRTAAFKGENYIGVEDWEGVFVGPDNGITPSSNFKLKEGAWKTGDTKQGEIGIYGGSGFSETALPPIPRITDKNIADQTDANGNLRVKITVKSE